MAPPAPSSTWDSSTWQARPSAFLAPPTSQVAVPLRVSVPPAPIDPATLRAGHSSSHPPVTAVAQRATSSAIASAPVVRRRARRRSSPRAPLPGGRAQAPTATTPLAVHDSRRGWRATIRDRRRTPCIAQADPILRHARRTDRTRTLGISGDRPHVGRVCRAQAAQSPRAPRPRRGCPWTSRTRRFVRRQVLARSYARRVSPVPE